MCTLTHTNTHTNLYKLFLTYPHVVRHLFHIWVNNFMTTPSEYKIKGVKGGTSIVMKVLLWVDSTKSLLIQHLYTIFNTSVSGISLTLLFL